MNKYVKYALIAGGAYFLFSRYLVSKISGKNTGIVPPNFNTNYEK